jgi:hypothetical protein
MNLEQAIAEVERLRDRNRDLMMRNAVTMATGETKVDFLGPVYQRHAEALDMVLTELRAPRTRRTIRDILKYVGQRCTSLGDRIVTPRIPDPPTARDMEWLPRLLRRASDEPEVPTRHNLR